MQDDFGIPIDFCGSDCSSPDLKEMVYQLVCDKIEDLEDNVQDIKISMDKVESKLSNLDLSGVESRFTEFNNALVVIQDREKDYLDNQARCNQMVNELKGIVSQVRGDMINKSLFDKFETFENNIYRLQIGWDKIRIKQKEMDKKVDAIFNLLSMKDE
jgi:prefoldin subunit 5